MNEVLRQLFRRKSVRVFTGQQISAEEKQAIIEAAMQAPTAGNQQMYTILDITDKHLAERLSESCDHQPFIAKASMILIFLADFQKWYDAFDEAGCNPRKPREGDLMLAVCDALIAAQNAVTAAESLGIGSCYIGDVMELRETHRELLHLPDYVFPAAIVVFGYPTKQQMERKKPKRAPYTSVVQENTYHRRSGEELRAMFEGRTGEKSYEEWMQAFCDRKYHSDFSKELSRSVRAYIEQFAET